MKEIAMVIWLGVTPAQVQTVQSQAVQTYKQANVLQQDESPPSPPPRRDSGGLPNSMR